MKTAHVVHMPPLIIEPVQYSLRCIFCPSEYHIHDGVLKDTRPVEYWY